MVEERENPHISAEQQRQVYHRVVADLVLEYTPSQGRVLDVGCGVGHVLEAVAAGDSSIAITAADPYPMCLEATLARVPTARTVKISETKIEIGSLGSEYDTCIMSHSLEHTLDPASTLRDLLSITRSGGHLVLAVPNPVRPTVFFGNLRRKHYVNRGHAYAWDPSHWRNFLERIMDLDVVAYAHDEVRFVPGGIVRRLPIFQKLEIAAGRMAPWWTFSNIAVVRRP